MYLVYDIFILLRLSSIGVGYSYADFGETVETTEDAARNVQAFITIFFENFSQFSGRRLHLSGESYAVSFCLLLVQRNASVKLKDY
jgi:Serine carboxypeptidase